MDETCRLRAPKLTRPFSIVLVEPEIPPNTGNIARLCAATGSRLYLVGKLGFRIDEQAVRRAGLDYWHLVEVNTQPTLSRTLAEIGVRSAGSRSWFFTGKAERSYLDVAFAPGDALVFGRESRGLDAEVLEQYSGSLVGIPTLGAVRSLNLANAVAIALYEALRQCRALDDAVLTR